MEAKLKKIDPHYFLIVDDKTFGSTMEPHLSASIRHALSLKNCQAIERGYDLDAIADELAFKHDDRFTLALVALRRGMELMGDKKFSEEDVKQAYLIGCDKQTTNNYHVERNLQSLQQTEWDVEIVMEEVSIGDKYTPEPKPKLDVDGCLILKRK
jgi:hypothetical protein